MIPAVDLNKETRLYFYAEFAKPFGSYQTWQSGELTHESSVRGDHIGFVTTQTTTAGEQVEVRIGISYICTEQAQRNLHRDTEGKSFEPIKLGTRGLWSDALGKVNTTGGTQRQRTIFYTALWRPLGRMTDITEDGRYFSGFDHTVHDADGHDFYVADGLWTPFAPCVRCSFCLTATGRRIWFVPISVGTSRAG
jgi:putative alpha-1,2-mannosidase